MHGVARQRLAAQQQRRREEGAFGNALAHAARSRRPRRTPLRRPAAAAPRARPRRLLRPARPARPCARPRPPGRPPPPWPAARASASATASSCWRGTMARRIAVHFWPALTVISRATSLTKRSNSGSSGVTSGPRMAQFSESASALNGTERRTRFGVHAQPGRGVGRSGEGDDVLAVEPVEQVAGAADHQLQRAGGQQPRLVHQPHRRPR